MITEWITHIMKRNYEAFYSLTSLTEAFDYLLFWEVQPSSKEDSFSLVKIFFLHELTGVQNSYFIGLYHLKFYLLFTIFHNSLSNGLLPTSLLQKIQKYKTLQEARLHSYCYFYLVREKICYCFFLFYFLPILW